MKRINLGGIFCAISIFAISDMAIADKSIEATAVGNGLTYIFKGSSGSLGITTGGTLKNLIMPVGGPDHIFNEGYASCYGPTTGNENNAHEIFSVTSNIVLSPAVLADACPSAGIGSSIGVGNLSPDGNGCSNYRFDTNSGTAPTVSPAQPLDARLFTSTSDGALRFTNRFQWDGVSKTVTATMTVKNTSASNVNVTLKRFADLDMNGSFTDWAGKTYDAYFAWDEGGRFAELRAASDVPNLVNLDIYPSNDYSTCPTDTAGDPSTNQADNTGILEWGLGVLAPNQSVTRVVTYSVLGL